MDIEPKRLWPKVLALFGGTSGHEAAGRQEVKPEISLVADAVSLVEEWGCWEWDIVGTATDAGREFVSLSTQYRYVFEYLELLRTGGDNTFSALVSQHIETAIVQVRLRDFSAVTQALVSLAPPLHIEGGDSLGVDFDAAGVAVTTVTLRAWGRRQEVRHP